MKGLAPPKQCKIGHIRSFGAMRRPEFDSFLQNKLLSPLLQAWEMPDGTVIGFEPGDERKVQRIDLSLCGDKTVRFIVLEKSR